MTYGIASAGHPTQKSSVEMLEYAAQAGIHTIDTASAYGNAEEIVGEFLGGQKRSQVRVITKIKPDALNGIPSGKYYGKLKSNVEKSLEKLRCDYVDGCLFHNAAYVHDADALAALSRLKEDKLTLKSGVSIYLPEEFNAAASSTFVDLIQIPYNILDQRLNAALKNKRQGLEIHARSAFLQGLLLMQENNIPSHLSAAKPYIREIEAFCSDHKISCAALLLGFVKSQKAIDRIVFGVDNLMQLKQIISDYQTEINPSLLSEFAKKFAGVDEYIIMPSLWKGDNK